jgi:N-acetyl-anhydromuramyl-L-alanine amidase AmpD
LERPGVRQWAFPGDGYLDSICAIANSIIGGTATMSEPTQADIGYPVEIDYASLIGPDRSLAAVQWFIVHDTEGGEQGSEGVLKGQSASVHALIDTDGAFEYMVPIEKTAWTAGNDAVSKLAIQVELVGFAANAAYPEEQYRSMAAFFRWCQSRGMNIPVTYIGKVDANGGPLPDVPGIIGHQDVPNPNVPGAWGGVSGHTDPGPHFDWQHFIDAINGAPITPHGSPTYRFFAETGHGIDGGFRTYWEANGGLDIFGFPLSEEVQDQGRTTQFFQRCVMRYFPEFKGTAYEVQLDLLGATAAAAAGYRGAGIP